MHENREISSAPSVIDEGRSVKAHSRTTDTHALEKSDCAVLPVNRPNKGRQLPAEAGEGRAQMKENIDQPHMLPPSTSCFRCLIGFLFEARDFLGTMAESTTSHFRLRASAMSRSNSGREPFEPETPWLVYLATICQARRRTLAMRTTAFQILSAQHGNARIKSYAGNSGGVS